MQFLLKRGETVLAVLDQCCPSDEMFWLKCEFQPTPAFAEVAAFYEEIRTIDGDVDRIMEIYDQLSDTGVRLVRLPSGTVIEDFFFILQDETVFIRYVDPADLT
ncbi:MAG: hypothetical protein JXA10_12780 [Anaerolineae bacterium]|nr:hypothetical protein [Anaerolineae bacterium]